MYLIDPIFYFLHFNKNTTFRRCSYGAVSSDIMTSDHSASAGNGGTFQVLRSILREEGVRGAFRGFSVRIMKITPACAIMISSYETGKVFFSRPVISPHENIDLSDNLSLVVKR